jgi:hypothetical protein
MISDTKHPSIRMTNISEHHIVVLTTHAKTMIEPRNKSTKDKHNKQQTKKANTCDLLGLSLTLALHALLDFWFLRCFRCSSCLLWLQPRDWHKWDMGTMRLNCIPRNPGERHARQWRWWVHHPRWRAASTTAADLLPQRGVLGHNEGDPRVEVIYHRVHRLHFLLQLFHVPFLPLPRQLRALAVPHQPGGAARVLVLTDRASLVRALRGGPQSRSRRWIDGTWPHPCSAQVSPASA